MPKRVGTINDDGRTCSKCLEFKPWSEFAKNARGPHGRRPDCKTCLKPLYNAYTENHKDELKEKRKQSYWDNRELFLERNRQWRADNPLSEEGRDKRNAKHRQEYWADRDARLEKARGRYWADVERVRSAQREKDKRLYWANPERARQQSRDYYAVNREAERKRAKKFYEANRESERARWAKYSKTPGGIEARHRSRTEYRSRKLRVPHADYTRQQVIGLYGSVCYLCNTGIDGDWHVDHVIPVSKGGFDMLFNVRPSHPKCNISKSDKIDYDNPLTLELLGLSLGYICVTLMQEVQNLSRYW